MVHNRKSEDEALDKLANGNEYTVESPVDDKDTDKDGIYDYWEKNGWTIDEDGDKRSWIGLREQFQKKFTNQLFPSKEYKKLPPEESKKVDDSVNEELKKYTKYITNPRLFSTTGDPYSDFDHPRPGSKLIINKEALEVENPRVTALPSLRVKINKIILSTKIDVTSSEGKTKEHTTTSSTSDAESKQWDVHGGASFGLSQKGPSLELSVNGGYGETNTHTTSAEISDSSTKHTEEQFHLNTGEAGYIGLNVTYENIGTDTIKGAKPHFNIRFEDEKDAFLSLSAKNSNAALSLSPGETKETVITANDDFNAQVGIPLNQEKINNLYHGKRLVITLSETEGFYGDSPTDQWSYKEAAIKARTARITLITPDEKMYDRRVACKGEDRDSKYTPDISLKEAILLAFKGEEKDGHLICKNFHIDSNTTIIFDDKANEAIENFRDPANKQNIGEKLMLAPGMGIIIRPKKNIDEKQIQSAFKNIYLEFTKRQNTGDYDSMKVYFSSSVTYDTVKKLSNTIKQLEIVSSHDQSKIINAHAKVTWEPEKKLVIISLIDSNQQAMRDKFPFRVNGLVAKHSIGLFYGIVGIDHPTGDID